MAEGRGKEAWGRTSALLALLVNLHRDPKKGRAARPADYNPYMRKKPIRLESLAFLKSSFVKENSDEESSSLDLNMDDADRSFDFSSSEGVDTERTGENVRDS